MEYSPASIRSATKRCANMTEPTTQSFSDGDLSLGNKRFQTRIRWSALMELAQSKADHRILVWNLLFPRLKSPSEKLCVVGSVMLAHRLGADRMDAGEYSIIYELLGHPHEIIRRPIIEELSRSMHEDDAGAQRNEISV